MTGTLAVVLVIASFVGASDLLKRFDDEKNRWKYVVLAGAMGGAFGIYGNLSGVALNGAVISVRDIGPMLAGYIGGPIGGFVAGAIAGIHRLSMGGITAQACVVATCLIGTICGILANKYREKIMKTQWSFTTGVFMEVMHLSLVLIMVKPFDTALGIVRTIAVPFILVNALGFSLLMTITTYIDRQRDMALEQSRLQSELEVATVIQHSVLPPITERYPGRDEIDIMASMDPAKEVGGDFYDIFFVDQNRMALVMADVSGKGIPAALFMMNAKQVMQNCVRDIPSLAEAVTTANNSLCEGNEAEMFVTLWIGVLDLSTGQLTYVNAGHNPPVLMTKNGTDYLRTKSGFVLAGMEGIHYTANELTLAPGDGLYLYTDGVTEAENAVHDLLGEDKLLACLTESADKTAAEIIDAVKGIIDEHVAGNAQFDDITMLCVKRK